VRSKKRVLFALFVLVGLTLLAACQGKDEGTETVKEVEVTRIVTEKETIIEQETIIVEVTPTPRPESEGPRTLVVCQGQEPDTLYIYGGSTLAARQVQQAIYDGPIDNRTFGYQPVILEKLPSLADGDAVIKIITVETGDLVVDNDLEVVTLEPGILVRPAGCYSTDCAIEFDGNPLEMEQMEVNFELKQGLVWSDGEPLTAYDSVYSFELLKDPDTPASRYFTDRTASYEAVDDYVTVWTSLPGFRDDTYFANFWPPLPEHIWGEFTALELIEAEESARMPLGWGPYEIVEWVAGDHITLVKNENYWRAGEGLPKFDTVIFRFTPQAQDANIAAVLAAKCDIVDQTANLENQSGLLLELAAVGKVNAAFVIGNARAGGTIWEHADFGINPAPGYDRPDFFEDVRVRQAVAYCMDRQKIIDTVMFGQSVVLDTFLPPNHPLYNPNVKQYPFDPQAGIALLEDVGWIDDDGDPGTPRVAQDVEGVSDGTALEFNYATIDDAHHEAVAGILQTSLAGCGIQVNVDYWSQPEFLVEGPEGPIFGRRFDMGQFRWMARLGEPPRCDLYLGTEIPGEENGWDYLKGNAPGFINEDFDAACDAARQLLAGQPGYEEYHLQAQEIFAEQLPVVPLYPHLTLAVTRPDLTGLSMDPTESEMWNIENFDY
jgi:peptide/nickel transport system substrate-binding protein